MAAAVAFNELLDLLIRNTLSQYFVKKSNVFRKYKKLCTFFKGLFVCKPMSLAFLGISGCSLAGCLMIKGIPSMQNPRHILHWQKKSVHNFLEFLTATRKHLSVTDLAQCCLTYIDNFFTWLFDCRCSFGVLVNIFWTKSRDMSSIVQNNHKVQCIGK